MKKRLLAKLGAIGAVIGGALVGGAVVALVLAATANMALDLPTVGVTAGPTYATLINAALTTIDSHTHASGSGVKVPVAGLNINANLDMEPSSTEYAVFAAKYYGLREQSSSPAAANSLWSNAAGEMVWRDDGNKDTVITDDGSISASTIGGIGGDYSTTNAVINYSNTTKAYVALQDTAKTADWIVGELCISEPGVSSAKVICHKSPSSLAADYDFTYPAALPSADAFLKYSSSGVMSFTGVPWVTIGDGTNSAGDYEGTNNTPFTDAITALSSGGVIIVGRGTYTFTATLDITQDDISIIGVGRDIVHIQGAINGALIKVNADHVRISGLHLNQTNTANNNTITIHLASTNAIIEGNQLEHSNTGTSGTGRRVVWINGDRNQVRNNSIQASTSGTSKNTYGVWIGDIVGSTGDIDVLNNIVDGNIVTITDVSSTTAGGAVFFLVADSTGAANVDTDVKGNIISNNTVLDAGQVAYLITLDCMTDAASMTADLFGNVIIGNTFLDQARTNTVLIVEDDSGGGTAEIEGNNIVSNNFPGPVSGTGWAHSGVDTDENTIWAAGGGGLAFCADGTCASGVLLIDRHMNQER